MNTLEDRIRAATHAAADLVADNSAPPLDLSRAAGWTSRSWRWLHRGGRLGKPLVPLAAAAAVLLVAVSAVAIPRILGGPTPTSDRGLGAAPPRYLVTIHVDSDNQPDRSAVAIMLAPESGKTLRSWAGRSGGFFWALDVRNAVSGALTAQVEVPPSYNWGAVAAQGPRTFIASETQINMGPQTSYFYRLVISGDGTVTSLRRVGPGVNGEVEAASVTPDGRYVGYLTAITYGPAGQDARQEVVLASLRTGEVIASWPVPVIDTVASLSLDADGNALAVGAYYYRYDYRDFPGAINVVKHDLTQWTSVLRPATSGTSINKVPELLPQASTLALSPGGGTLYELLQAGRVSSRPQLDRNLVTFYLAAVNARTGTVVSVLHVWRAVCAVFQPQLALDPSGSYLLIADGASLARVSARTGQYTALPGSVPEILANLGGKYPVGQSDDIDPLAW